ncbi:hypothetical protein GJU40_07115 [Bacillus lacus]|uniref:CobW C-terminal domain-containing protein n=1 Tax=Metabacillus lacus TaxID=1983721 RepID=A0A7X2IY39_9BACI|nr:GTP-binding protein [Metabacillus lacus]MRX71942.1 hypothetical protein [Metabacillus lacus]
MNTIPVYIISGFLGSGKTTVLINLLQELKRQRKTPGIILNELGEKNVEKHLFTDQQVFELLNGCICCTIQEDLKLTLKEFAKEAQVKGADVLLIEGTGVANPLEITEALLSPEFFHTYELKSIISVIDAANFLEYQSIFSSSKEIRTLLKDQVAYASSLIVNKTDMADEKKRKKIESKLQSMLKNKQGNLYFTSYGDVAAEALLNTAIPIVTLGKNEKSCGCPPDCDGEHVRKHSNHGAFQAVKIENVPSINQQNFKKWLQSLPSDIIRGKGVVRLAETGQLYDFQYAGKQLNMSKLESNDEECVIVLIGLQGSTDSLRQSFESAFL